MTLGELVGLVGDKLNMTDDKTLRLLRRFAERRHSMLCGMGLWRELLSLYPLTVEAGKPEVILPPQVANVVAVRTGEANLLPVDTMYGFMTDPGLWERVGSPTGFCSLPSVATWNPPEGQQLAIYSHSPADVSQTVTVEGEYVGTRRWQSLTLTGPSPVVTSDCYDVVYKITKADTQEVVTVLNEDDYTVLAELGPSEAQKTYRRIRLLETPQSDTPLVVLAKRRAAPLVEDSDATAFDGLDLALEAFILADAYEWLRQMQDAAEKRQEAVAMLEQLKRAEFYQEAQQQRLVPTVWGAETGEYNTLHGGGL